MILSFYIKNFFENFQISPEILFYFFRKIKISKIYWKFIGELLSFESLIKMSIIFLKFIFDLKN